MATLKNRLSDLEAQAASTDHRVRVYYLNEGENEAQARLDAGIAVDYAGKVICVHFISSPNELKEPRDAND